MNSSSCGQVPPQLKETYVIHNGVAIRQSYIYDGMLQDFDRSAALRYNVSYVQLTTRILERSHSPA